MMRVPIAHGKHGKEQRKKYFNFVFPTSLVFCATGLLHWLKIQANLDSFWNY